jgi:DNA-binding CsgD family transcriptional regulator
MRVLRFVTSGLRYKEIGKRLGISTRTVHGHMKDLRYRLGFPRRSRVDLAHVISRAIETGWYPPPRGQTLRVEGREARKLTSLIRSGGSRKEVQSKLDVKVRAFYAKLERLCTQLKLPARVGLPRVPNPWPALVYYLASRPTADRQRKSLRLTVAGRMAERDRW